MRTATGLVRTARIIRGTRSGSVSKIGRYLDIAYEDALRLVHPFVRMGVLAPPDSAGFRALRTGARATVLLFVMALGGRAAVRRTQPDWQLITSYVELDRIAARCHWLEGEAFLDGPIARFLALAGEPDLPARAGARILEYGRYRAAAFASTLDGGAPARNAFEQAALALAEQRLGSGRHGRYLAAVFAGRASHNSAGE